MVKTQNVVPSKQQVDESIRIGPSNLVDGTASHNPSIAHSFDEGSETDCKTVGNASTATALLKKRKVKWYLRLFILFIAGIIGFLVCGVVFYAAQEGEREEFQVAYDELSDQVIRTLVSDFDRKLAKMNSLSIAFTSYSLENDASWPNVTLPNFNLLVGNNGAVDDTLSYLYAPFVTDPLLWESFSRENVQFLDDGKKEPKALMEEIFNANSSGATLAPVWQHFPPSSSLINYDMMSADHLSSDATTRLLASNRVVAGPLFEVNSEKSDDELAVYLSHLAEQSFEEATDLYATFLYFPVFDAFTGTKTLVALVASELVWNTLFTDMIPLGENDELIFIVSDGCGSVHTFRVRDTTSSYVRKGDQHDTAFDHMEKQFSVDNLEWQGLTTFDSGFCPYSIRVFPTVNLEREYVTFKPVLYTASAAVVFTIIFVMSIAYERRVERMNENAVEYRAIVSNLFPAVVRDRLFRRRVDERSERKKSKRGNRRLASKPNQSSVTRTARFLDQIDENGADDAAAISKPIADSFPHTTVLFADIAGFTAWSADREPEEVFTLLQVLFNEFDKIARKRRVFKVETIGDCYMAVTGLPAPQSDHAERMTKFASECLSRVNPLLEKLQRPLGPDTTNLAMRFGLHSGPVTAGVLQGEKSRFQLFGDTVNTASRMESTGEKGRIHLSSKTAKLVFRAGKGHWLEKREDAVHAKGKGQLETYWVVDRSRARPEGGSIRRPSINTNAGSDRLSESGRLSDTEQMTTSCTSISATSADDFSAVSSRIGVPRVIPLQALPSITTDENDTGLVDWHVQVMGSYLKEIMFQRRQSNVVGRVENPATAYSRGTCVLDEFSETIPLAKTPSRDVMHHSRSRKPQLTQAASLQLRDFVVTIAKGYRQNAFHNFVQATHVAMFCRKLLLRSTRRNSSPTGADLASTISSDPLLQFSIHFAALIHDIDHGGISNEQLKKQDPELSRLYNGRMISEQHSVDLGWELLMDPRYSDLQECIFATRAELARFRQIVVNLVLSSDLRDKEMNAIRNLRWNETFESPIQVISGREKKRHQIAIIAETLLQLADISHTMQDWKAFTQMSRKGFQEAFQAYSACRSDPDPAKYWYKEQLYVLDNHTIPLLQNLQKTNIMKCDELLMNATINRRAWSIYGAAMVLKFASGLPVSDGADDSVMVYCHGSNNSSYHFDFEGDEDWDSELCL